MTAGPHTFLLDAHALSLLAEDSPAMQEWVALARRTSSVMCVSTATLAETTDGTARDANVRCTEKAAKRVAVSDEIGYTAGRLRALAASTRRKPRDLTVDAIVAATALSLRPPVVVLTSDRPDLTAMLDGTGVRVRTVG